jgi:V/A-type H+-transporting ATPase subunit D
VEKIKLTKGELKRQRDALSQYERFLPTLQLKKQQLQMEILHQQVLLEEKKRFLESKLNSAQAWSGVLAEGIELSSFIRPQEIIFGVRNIAGVDLPVFERIDFSGLDYDLFLMPLWLDSAIEALRVVVSLREEIKILQQGVDILRGELCITTQRVNLFEKVKIPEAEEAIRLIKIYLGDQMSNAVGRSKIAKRKIEEAVLEEVLA